jgi:hypothetical protein
MQVSKRFVPNALCAALTFAQNQKFAIPSLSKTHKKSFSKTPILFIVND